MFERLLLKLLKSYFVGMPDCYYWEDTIPQKKVDNAFEYYKIPDNQRIYALIDMTLWGSAKDGIAFTDVGIYWKNDHHQRMPFLFNDIDSLLYSNLKDYTVLWNQDDVIIGSSKSVLFNLTDISDFCKKNPTSDMEETKYFHISNSKFFSSLIEEIIDLCQKKEQLETTEAKIQDYDESLDYEQVLRWINEILAFEPNNLDYRFKEIDVLAKSGNFALADKKLNSLLNIYLNTIEYKNKLEKELEKLEEKTVNSDTYRQSVASLKEKISSLSNEVMLKNMNTDEKSAYSEMKVLESKCLVGLNKYINAYWSLIIAAEFAQDFEHRNEIIDEINSIYSKHIITNFSNMDYLKRKVIYFDDNFNSFKPKSIFPLNVHNKGNLKFPPSHPVHGQLYVGHPFIENLYYPIEDYENYLFQSQVMELSSLLKSLGAVKIKTEYIKATTNSIEHKEVQSHHENKNTGVDSAFGNKVGGFQQSTNVDKSTTALSESASQNESQVGKKMTIDGTFKPTKKPFIPEDLIWFEHNEIWKSLAKQRLEGGLESYDLILSTKNVEQVNERELKTIDEEYKMLLSVSGGNIITKGKNDIKNETDSSKSYESLLKLKKKETNEIRVYVEFAPMETLTEEAPKLTNKDSKQKSELKIEGSDHSEAETDFIEFLHDLIEDGTIEDASRRVLERRRIKLGLSEERAKAIEDKILNKSNFSENELDFLQEIEFCFADDGIINESEMRMINRERQKLGITEERSVELIEFIKNKRELL